MNENREPNKPTEHNTDATQSPTGLVPSTIPGYLKDKETGYLVAINSRGSNAFGVESKTRFLTELVEDGTLTGTCKLLGLSDRTVYDHLAIDEAFKRDYALAVRRMASRLESTMYKNGQKAQGYMDRVTWLRRWYPNEWTPRTNVSVGITDNNSVDSLYSQISAPIIIDTESLS